MSVESTQQRFVTIPYLKYLSDQQLNYADILTYLSLKSFNDSDRDLCFPSYETISERSGCSMTFVRESIARLSNAKLIQIKKSTQFRKPNKYWFSDIPGCSKIPHSFFKIDDLTVNEKAMLLCLFQFFAAKGRIMPRTLTNFSTSLGVGFKTLEVQYKSLINKGYIEESVFLTESGKEKIYCSLTDKVNWIFPPYVCSETITLNLA